MGTLMGRGSSSNEDEPPQLPPRVRVYTYYLVSENLLLKYVCEMQLHIL